MHALDSDFKFNNNFSKNRKRENFINYSIIAMFEKMAYYFAVS